MFLESWVKNIIFIVLYNTLSIYLGICFMVSLEGSNLPNLADGPCKGIDLCWVCKYLRWQKEFPKNVNFDSSEGNYLTILWCIYNWTLALYFNFAKNPDLGNNLCRSDYSSGSRISLGHQPIIWHNVCRKLHENEKKLDWSATKSFIPTCQREFGATTFSLFSGIPVDHLAVSWPRN